MYVWRSSIYIYIYTHTHTHRVSSSDTRQDVSADQLAGGGVIESDDYVASQMTSLRDIPARMLTWWYTSVVEKSDYDSTPVKVCFLPCIHIYVHE